MRYRPTTERMWNIANVLFIYLKLNIYTLSKWRPSNSLYMNIIQISRFDRWNGRSITAGYDFDIWVGCFYCRIELAVILYKYRQEKTQRFKKKCSFDKGCFPVWPSMEKMWRNQEIYKLTFIVVHWAFLISHRNIIKLKGLWVSHCCTNWTPWSPRVSPRKLNTVNNILQKQRNSNNNNFLQMETSMLRNIT